MAFGFRKSIRIAPGVRLNFGKKSASVSVGGKGFRYTTGTKGSRATVGIPGTGLHYTEKLNKRGNKNGNPPSDLISLALGVFFIIAVPFVILIIIGLLT